MSLIPEVGVLKNIPDDLNVCEVFGVSLLGVDIGEQQHLVLSAEGRKYINSFSFCLVNFFWRTDKGDSL